jgi:cytolysin (calcineurin-like family phosphatase)
MIQGEPASAGQSVTFLFLSDPQIEGNAAPRAGQVSTLNHVLSGISGQPWPKELGLNGQPIGPVSCLVIAGDLTQDGGGYNFLEQVMNLPQEYQGGPSLSGVHELFDKTAGAGDYTKTTYSPVYFGLGNHDLGDSAIVVPWVGGGKPGAGGTDYARDQMWNFICQMHTGVRWRNGKSAAAYPVTAVDSDGSGSNDWTARSFNYRVNLGPADLIQLHRYGGDSEYGRASGLGWLKDQLGALGTARPVIIVQHYQFQPPMIDVDWTDAQRDALLEVLAPYNVIALLTGHIHNPPDHFPYQAPIPGTSDYLNEFRPGCAFNDPAIPPSQGFIAVRVTPPGDTLAGPVPGSLTIARGSTASGAVAWTNSAAIEFSPWVDSVIPF